MLGRGARHGESGGAASARSNSHATVLVLLTARQWCFA
jgi:hypothetical protein